MAALDCACLAFRPRDTHGRSPTVQYQPRGWPRPQRQKGEVCALSCFSCRATHTLSLSLSFSLSLSLARARSLALARSLARSLPCSCLDRVAVVATAGFAPAAATQLGPFRLAGEREWTVYQPETIRPNRQRHNESFEALNSHPFPDYSLTVLFPT